MGSRTTPIDIALSSRHGSPRSSNLTSALQTTSGNEARPSSVLDTSEGLNKGLGFGLGAVGSGSQYSGGAQPISVNASNREKPRRESLAGSMVTGMSWGGTSVGSWIRDDIIMQGTSPFAYQSPSFHSSSYLPRLEANFMRDFTCCGMTLPTLHELLQHYEDHHTDQIPPPLQKQNSNQNNLPPDSKAALAAAAATGIQGQGRQPPPPNIDTSVQGQAATPSTSSPATPRQSQQPAQIMRGFAPRQPVAIADDDAVEDMEMEDDFGMAPVQQQTQYPQNRARLSQPSHFGQPASNRVPPLDMNALNMGIQLQQQHQGLRNSQPTTPVSAGRNGMYHNNPTVSSVNTPTLSTYNNSSHPLQQQQQQFYTPDSSAPGTPGELEGDIVGNMGNMNMGVGHYNQPFGGYDYGNRNEMLDVCINEPEKTLWAQNGGWDNPPPPPQPPPPPPQQQQQHQPRPQATSAIQLGDGQYGENSEIARTIREQQRLAGMPEPVLDGGVPKPFQCPVIGCEKAYKNHNGLKYHKSHGHNTQTLHANENGTFSIVDPETLTPYPGTLGMERHKPHRCETCGKRYKNLNGLKYHKNHSPRCDNQPSPPLSSRPIPPSSAHP